MKTHIVDWESKYPWKTLCGRDVAQGSQLKTEWDTQVFKQIQKQDWCLTCKMLFNANYSHKYHKILK